MGAATVGCFLPPRGATHQGVSMNPNQRPPAASPAAHSPSSKAARAPQPVSARENNGLMYFFIGAAVLALLVAIGFNWLGPQGASRTGVGDGPAQAPGGVSTGGPSTGNGSGAGSVSGNTTAAGTDGTTATTPLGGTATTTTITGPQAPDTPTPPGRESVGAPMGSVPQASQGGPSATAQGAGGTGGAGAATGSTPAAPGAATNAPAASPATPAASQ